LLVVVVVVVVVVDNGVNCTVVVTGSDGRLDGMCLPGNRCLDDGVFCSRGVCKCTTDRFVKNGKCGKL